MRTPTEQELDRKIMFRSVETEKNFFYFENMENNEDGN